jgi:hypothetical protein
MSTVQHLYAIDQPIVATLILLFALIVPIVKGVFASPSSRAPTSARPLRVALT